MEANEFFTEEWSGHEKALRRWLARAGVPAHDVDDVLQETAVRVLRSWTEIDHVSPMGPLLRRIALNLWRDSLRRRLPVPAGDELPDQQAVAGDPELTVLSRLEVNRVSRALAELPAAVAATLRTAAEESLQAEPGSPSPPRVRMSRTRARQALRSTLARISAAAGVAAAVIRALRGPRPAAQVAAAGAVALVLIAFVFVWDLPHRDDPDRGAGEGSAAGRASVVLDHSATRAMERAAIRLDLGREASSEYQRRGPLIRLPHRIPGTKPSTPRSGLIGFMTDLPVLGPRTVNVRADPAQPVCVTAPSDDDPIGRTPLACGR